MSYHLSAGLTGKLKFNDEKIVKNIPTIGSNKYSAYKI